MHTEGKTQMIIVKAAGFSQIAARTNMERWMEGQIVVQEVQKQQECMQP